MNVARYGGALLGLSLCCPQQVREMHCPIMSEVGASSGHQISRRLRQKINNYKNEFLLPFKSAVLSRSQTFPPEKSKRYL
jgi:hypothetical protein